MRVVRIEGPADPRVAEYRVISDRDLMRSRGLFVAEGRAVVERLLADGQHRLRSVLLSEAAVRALDSVLQSAPEDLVVYVGAVRDFLAITGFNLHRGCLALAERPAPGDPFELLAASRVVVILEDVANPDNMGGVFRNAAAFDVSAVLLSPGCCDPLYRKTIRTSMAASLRVPFAVIHDWPAALERVRAAGFRIVALTPGEPSSTIDEIAAEPMPSRLALLLGAEGRGLTPAASALADARVRIPINPQVDSLNLAVAAGIALSRLSRTRLSDIS